MTANEKDFPQPQYPSKENGYNRGLGSPSDKLRDAGFNTELTIFQLLDKLQSENESLKAALKELFELKDLEIDEDDFLRIEMDYETRKPLAWEAARKLLNT